jgi:hypothetical protein
MLSIGAYAHKQVVVIPLGDSHDIQGANCPPAAGNNTIGSPAALYNFCWYLSAPSTSCDAVCADVGGTNLAIQAENERSDDGCSAGAGGASDADVSTWFFNSGNPRGWGRLGDYTGYHTLGYGIVSSVYFGKCSTGSVDTLGVYPGETNGTGHNVVCPCFGFVAP